MHKDLSYSHKSDIYTYVFDPKESNEPYTFALKQVQKG